MRPSSLSSLELSVQRLNSLFNDLVHFVRQAHQLFCLLFVIPTLIPSFPIIAEAQRTTPHTNKTSITEQGQGDGSADSMNGSNGLSTVTHATQRAVATSTTSSSGVQATPTTAATEQVDPHAHTTTTPVDTGTNLAPAAVADVLASTVQTQTTSTSKHTSYSQAAISPEVPLALPTSTSASTGAQTPPTISNLDSQEDLFSPPANSRTPSQSFTAPSSRSLPSRQHLTNLLDHAELGE